LSFFSSSLFVLLFFSSYPSSCSLHLSFILLHLIFLLLALLRLTPQSRVFLENLLVAQLLKKVSSFCVTLPFSQQPTTGPCPEPDQSSSHPISVRSILKLSFHLCLGHPSGLFPLDFITELLYRFFISPMHATCLAQLPYSFSSPFLSLVSSHFRMFLIHLSSSLSFSYFFLSPFLLVLPRSFTLGKTQLLIEVPKWKLTLFKNTH
jgi:hypothetical protein